MTTLVEKINSGFNRVGTILKTIQAQVVTNSGDIASLSSKLSNVLTNRNRDTNPFQLQSTTSDKIGGDPRGTGAVDLQMDRTASSQVASGAYSFAVGGNNTSSNVNSVAMGGNNTASGMYSLSMGYGNTASTTWSISLGGFNTASGANSFSAGFFCTSSGVCAVSIGFQNLSDGFSSTVFGKFGTSGTNASCLINSYHDSIRGKAQGGNYGLYADTTDATPTVAKSSTSGSNNGSSELVLRDNSSFSVSGLAVARDSNGVSKSFEVKVLISRGSGASSVKIIGSSVTTVFNDKTSPPWSIQVASNTNIGGLSITVIGEKDKKISWTLSLNTAEAM